MFGKELFVTFTVCVFRKPSSICVCASFPSDFEGGLWDSTVLVSDHRLSSYFPLYQVS